MVLWPNWCLLQQLNDAGFVQFIFYKSNNVNVTDTYKGSSIYYVIKVREGSRFWRGTLEMIMDYI